MALKTTFKYYGTELNYFDHPYNTTLLNERCVEIAIAHWWLKYQTLCRGLEVGNVLGHYSKYRPWRVVDKYERAPAVENIDVLDIREEYEWIISISTLEHVGLDEGGTAEKGVKALRRLQQCGKTMLVTLPGGINKLFDEMILNGTTGAKRSCTLIRNGVEWEQTGGSPEYGPLIIKPYGLTTKWAESVAILEYER